MYYIAEFTYKVADKAKTEELKAFATDHKIYRQETLTDMASFKVAQNFYNPLANGSTEPAQLAEAL